MKEVITSRILRTIPVLIAVCIVSIPAQAQYGGGSGTTASAEMSTYLFLSDQSTVVQTGGFAGVHETYPIQGQFQLTVDANAGAASFDYVDAFLLSPVSSSPPQSLGELFNMTELQGTVVNDALIEFRGKTADNTNTDIALTLTFTNDAVQLTGQTIPPPNSADFFIFELDAVAQRKYGGGTGEPNDPYLIYTAEQMNEIGLHEDDWDKHFKLMANVDLLDFDGKEGRPPFNMIAPDTNDAMRVFDGTPFTGVFDGNGHTISNFTYTSTDTNRIGLFGCVEKENVEENVEIKNLGLIDPNVDAGTANDVGSLVGWLRRGTITNCYVDGGGVSGNYSVGGIAGYSSGIIIDCYANSSVMGSGNVGGMVGSNDGIITSCCASSVVIGNTRIGGMVGYNYDGEIINCCASSVVIGNTNVGGMVGRNGIYIYKSGVFSPHEATDG